MHYNIFRHIPHGGRHLSSVILSEHLEPISKIRGLLIWIQDIVMRATVPAQGHRKERQALGATCSCSSGLGTEPVVHNHNAPLAPELLP